MARLHLRSTVAPILLVSGLVALLGLPSSPASGDDPDGTINLADYYGFEGPEIFKLQQRSANMLAGDLNGDGLTDLVLVDNSHSRIDLLQQRKTKPSDDSPAEPAVNGIGNDWRFEHRKIPVDKEVASMTLGDFNGDGRTDIAYFGVPDRLVIRHQPESGEWTHRQSIRLPEVNPVQWTMAAGDLNQDGRDDLVVLGKSVTYLIYQQQDGTLAPPKKLMNTSDKLGLAQIADLDGDGLADLCYVAAEGQERAFCARLQSPDGSLGPELRFDVDRTRGMTLSGVDGRNGSELLALDGRTGRVKALQLKQTEDKPGELAGRLIHFGFGEQGAGRDRDLATGDLDGDGLADVVVTDPDLAQMIVYRQRKGQGLDQGSTFPGLVGADQVRIADFDGDKAAEVVVLSTKERTLGLSRMEKDRLSFPQPLAVQDEPVALELADLNGDGRREIVYIAQKPGSSSELAMHALESTGTGGFKRYSFGKQQSVPVASRGTPQRMMRLDADGDGRPDFLAFPGLGRPPVLILMGADGVPKVAEVRGGIGLGDASAGSVFFGNLDKPALLVAHKNFARNMRLDDKGQWTVVDQYNAAESNARIAGVATIDLDGLPGSEIVLVDTGIKRLRVLRRDGSVYRHWREVELGDFPYQATHLADLNGDGRDDLLLFGRGKFSVLYAGRSDPALQEISSFETKLENTYFNDLVAGDLNGDGHPDVAVLDTRSHYVEILDFDPEQGLRHATHFKVFEEKSFSRRGASGSEPREALIADVTGDGRPDLVLLVHDRVLVYPQDDGK